VTRRIFLCHNVARSEQRESQLLNELHLKLQETGAKIIEYPGSPSEAGFLTFFQQQSLSCQWFILFQTPSLASIPAVQQAVNMTLKLVEPQGMEGIARIIATPGSPHEVPAVWAVIPTFDATYDPARALEKLLLHISSSKVAAEATAIMPPNFTPLLNKITINPAPAPSSAPASPIPASPLSNAPAPPTPGPPLGNVVVTPVPPPQPDNIMPPPVFTPHLSNAVVSPAPTPHLSNASPPSNYDRPPKPPGGLSKLGRAIRNTYEDMRYAHKRLLIIIPLLIFVVLAGSGVGLFLYLRPQTPRPHPRPVVHIPVYGQIYFSSTNPGLFQFSTPHVLDRVDIYLNNLKPPASGNSYYAWLMPDQAHTAGQTIALGQFTPDNGSAHITYVSPTQSNLLATEGGFLITEEPTSPQPQTPTANRAKWRYSGQIAQTPNVNDTNGFSALDYLRELLANGPVSMNGNSGSLSGGLGFRFVLETELIFDEAQDATGNDSSLTLAKNTWADSVCILDMLDGANLVGPDVPQGTPVICNPAKPLLTVNPNSATTGYIHDIEIDLRGFASSPDVTQAQQTLAGNIDAELNQVDGILEQVRNDAKQLAGMQLQDLLQSSAVPLLDDMTNQALSAYVGQLDPTTGNRQGGAISVFDQLQQLAQFPVFAYNAQG